MSYFPNSGSLVSSTLLRCTQNSGNSHIGVGAGLWFFLCISHNITSARRHAESGHEAKDRCERLSDSAGGVVYPSHSGLESGATPVVSLTLYVCLCLDITHRAACDFGLYRRHHCSGTNLLQQFISTRCVCSAASSWFIQTILGQILYFYWYAGR